MLIYYRLSVNMLRHCSMVTTVAMILGKLFSSSRYFLLQDFLFQHGPSLDRILISVSFSGAVMPRANDACRF